MGADFYAAMAKVVKEVTAGKDRRKGKHAKENGTGTKGRTGGVFETTGGAFEITGKKSSQFAF